jgi:hypothetical protein
MFDSTHTRRRSINDLMLHDSAGRASKEKASQSTTATSLHLL